MARDRTSIAISPTEKLGLSRLDAARELSRFRLGLSRNEAATYVGADLDLFDRMVEQGYLPAPRMLGRFENPILRWGIRDLGPPEAFGTVYLVGFADYVKIGFTFDLQDRIRALQTGAPERLRVILKLPGAISLERKLHDEFAEHRLEGEWFRHHDDLRTWIGRWEVAGDSAL